MEGRYLTNFRTVALIVAILAGAVPAIAAPGDLDPTFGNGGIVVRNVLSDPNYFVGLSAIKLQPDGKILVSGQLDSLYDFPSLSFIARFNADGSSDLSFGDNGMILPGLAGIDIVVQPDGKVVGLGIGGGSNGSNALFLQRFDSTGELDLSFGDGGSVVFTPPGTEEALYWNRSVVLRPDGKILVIGSAWIADGTMQGQQENRIVSFNPDGSFDDTFGDGGIAEFPHGIPFGSALVLPDGKFVIFGLRGIANGHQLVVTRLNADGSPDSSFGTNGSAVVFTQLEISIQGAGIQPDGKIVVGITGSAIMAEAQRLARLNIDGSVDTTFAASTTYRHNYLTTLAIQPDGKIVGIGPSSWNSGGLLVIRLNPNGSTDTSFGTDGTTRTPAGLCGCDGASRAVIQPDGKILLLTNRGDHEIALVRYQGAPPAAPFDYDGDGKTDISVYRPSNGNWYVARSQTSDMYVQLWRAGFAERIVPADHDGDGKTDLAFTFSDPSDFLLFFAILNSSTETATYPPAFFSDRVLSFDFDGDGKADPAGWTDGLWKINLSQLGFEYTQQWGMPGDQPTPADFDGDGRAELAVFRATEGKWYVVNVWTRSISTVSWGVLGDVPVVGDYSGDGKADFAVFRPSNNTWYRLHSDDYSMHAQTWGAQDDIPAPGDYDGDGRMDLAVFRPTEGNWYVFTAANTIFTSQFGQNGDVPTPSAFLY